MFTREYLFSWRHLEINSVLLLRLLVLSALIMKSFSVRQRLHRLEILLQAVSEEMIDQLILQFSQLSLSFQMCFANSVRLAYFLLRNDSLCYVYRCLNVPSVSPMQFFSCVVFACGHVGFVYYAGKDFLVAVVDDAAHVRHAAVADFHVLLVKDGVQIVVWWEVFLDSVVEGLSNVGPDFFCSMGVNQMMFHFLFLFVGVVVFSCSREGLR